MIRIKVDGQVLWAGEPGDWNDTSPEDFRQMMHPGHRPQPHMKPLAVVLADALSTNRDLRVNIVTTPNGFQMKVLYE